MKRIELAPAARDELAAAVEQYEIDYPGRGLRFAAAVARTIDAAAATPSAGPIFPGVPDNLGIRRRVVRGFPFAVAYRVVGDVLRVEAIAHTRRRRGYWLVR